MTNSGASTAAESGVIAARKQALHPHVFWLFGLIVGLGIREALIDVAPALTFDEEYHTQPQPLHVLRLCLYIAACFRFYLGGVRYFLAVHDKKPADIADQRWFVVDVGSGLAHYILFFIWGTTLLRGPSFILDLPWYMVGLFTVLLYDVLWYLLSVGRPGVKDQIGYWAFVNSVTCSFVLLLWLLIPDGGWREVIALLPAAAITLIDVHDNLSDDMMLPKFFRSITPALPDPQRPESDES